MSTASAPATDDLASRITAARDALDAHTVETVRWHFHESTGCPFWLEKKSALNFDPLTEVKSYDDLKKFPAFEDEWLRGGPVRRWVPKALADKPVYVFETGGTTGIPKSRIVIDDFRTDYELFSHTLPDEYFPKGSNWLMLGPSGPRRLRLAVEHLAQYRGGISFCIDLDPRWVVKLIKKGWHEHLEAYKQHCVDQAVTILTARHDVKCMFGTPKLIEALALALEERGTSIPEVGITGIFSGGTEFTPQWTRFCVEELFGGPPSRAACS
jgi:phenylacetate-coenzyme A ligase PaaK-like adenylate-forming protein